MSYELVEAVKEQTAAIEAFKAKYDGRIDELEKLIARKNRGGGNKSGDPSPAELQAERKAIGTFIRTGDETELKSLSVGSGPDGGYTVTPALSNSMTTRLWDESPVRRLARVETITEGDAFEEPVDDSESGASWVGENEARPKTSTPTLRLIRVPVQEIYANQTVTQRLLDDSRFDIGGWVEGKISDKFGRSEGVAYVAGDGVKRPRGFMDYDTDTTDDFSRKWGKLQYVVSGSAATIADAAGQANGLVDLYWKLRAPHRKNGTWLMASSTANALDKLKTTTGEYIWRAAMTAGAQPSLLGRPVEFDENMPAIGAGNFPVAFADFKAGYLIVEKAGLKLLRDPYTDKPNVVFYAYRRVGGGLANSDAIKLLKISA